MQSYKVAVLLQSVLSILMVLIGFMTHQPVYTVLAMVWLVVSTTEIAQLGYPLQRALLHTGLICIISATGLMLLTFYNN